MVSPSLPGDMALCFTVNNQFHLQSCHMPLLTKLKLPLLTQVTFNKDNSMDCTHTVLNAFLTYKTKKKILI